MNESDISSALMEITKERCSLLKTESNLQTGDRSCFLFQIPSPPPKKKNYTCLYCPSCNKYLAPNGHLHFSRSWKYNGKYSRPYLSPSYGNVMA